MNQKMGRRNFIKAGAISLTIPFLESFPSLARAAASGQSKRVIYVVHHQGHYQNMLFPQPSTYLTGAEGVRYQPLSAFTGDMSKILTAARFGNVKSKMNVLRGLDGLTRVGTNATVGHNQTFPLTAGGGVDNFNPLYEPFNPNSIDTVISESNAFYTSTPFKRVMRVSPVSDSGSMNWRFCYKNGTNVGYTAGAANVFTEYFSTPVGGGPAPVVTDTNLSRRVALNSVLNQVKALAGSTKISSADQKRLNDHANFVTSALNQIPAANTNTGSTALCSQPTKPNPSGNQANIRGIIDMMIAAFACQLTNVAVLYPRFVSEAGADDFNDPYHNNVFHSSPQDALYTQLKGFTYDQISYLVNKMDSITEANGKTMLDNSLVVVLSEFGGHAADHSGIDYSVITFGSLEGKIKTGNYINYQRPDAKAYSTTFLNPYKCNVGRPINQFHTTVLNALNITHNGFGDYANTDGQYAAFITDAMKQANLPMLT